MTPSRLDRSYSARKASSPAAVRRLRTSATKSAARVSIRAVMSAGRVAAASSASTQTVSSARYAARIAARAGSRPGGGSATKTESGAIGDSLGGRIARRTRHGVATRGGV